MARSVRNTTTNKTSVISLAVFSLVHEEANSLESIHIIFLFGGEALIAQPKSQRFLKFVSHYIPVISRSLGNTQSVVIFSRYYYAPITIFAIEVISWTMSLVFATLHFLHCDRDLTTATLSPEWLHIHQGN